MKKRICCFLAMIICVISIVSSPFISFAEITQTENIEKTQLGTSDTYYQFDASTKTLTISGTGLTPNFTANGATAPWFEWRQNSIDKVVVQQGVTGIGSYGLYQVRASEFYFPSTLKTLGIYALAGTLKMTSWQLPYGLTSIGNYCFDNCNTLTSIDIPDTVKKIGSRAFQNCTALEEITIPYSVTTLSSYSFYKCGALKQVTFESMSAPVSIGSYCFAQCGNLKSIQIPSNATMSSYTYGYATKTSKYSDVKMTVFENSPALVYAQANSIDYDIYNSIPVECAVGYTNTYTQDNMENRYSYTFIPQFSSNYNIYTRGDCDVKATLYQDDVVINENDDISSADRNFCISAQLEKGVKYTLIIESVKAQGTYTLWVYPNEMLSVITYGTVTANAEKNMKTVDDNLLNNIVLQIDFNGGISDKIYYSNDFFNNIQISQKTKALTCGVGTGLISVGDLDAEYDLYIEHTYTSVKVGYTLNDDGYTLYTCVLCSNQYKSDFVPTTAITVIGKCVLAENKKLEHSHNYPYPYAKVKVNGVEYPVNSDGTFKFNTFYDCYAVFLNENGTNQTLLVEVEDEPVNYGYVALEGYDFNSDGVVNGKDFGIFINKKSDSYGMDYWQFASNFV